MIWIWFDRYGMIWFWCMSDMRYWDTDICMIKYDLMIWFMIKVDILYYILYYIMIMNIMWYDSIWYDMIWYDSYSWLIW